MQPAFRGRPSQAARPGSKGSPGASTYCNGVSAGQSTMTRLKGVARLSSMRTQQDLLMVLLFLGHLLRTLFLPTIDSISSKYFNGAI